MKKNKMVTVLFSIFAIVGIVFLIVGSIVLIQGLRFRENAVSISSEIADIEIYIVFTVFLIIGVIFFLVGTIPLSVIMKRKRKNENLLMNGRVLHAVVDDISWNTNYSVNGQHPFVIYCSYKDDYKDIIYRFKSGNLWTDPALVFAPGSYIDVYVDENDYSKYYVNAEKILSEKVIDYTM